MYSRAVHRGRRLSGLSCQRTSARGRGERQGLPVDAGRGRGKELEENPGQKAGRPNDARRPELPASKGMLAQCGRGGAARHGGSRQLRRPNDLLLGPQDNEVAAARARKLGVGLFPFALGGVCGVASEACRACAAEGADEWRGCPLPAEPSVWAANHLRGLRSDGRNGEVHARERHVDRDGGTALAADAGDGTFDGRGTCREHACGGACGTVVAVRVKRQSTPTPGRAAAQGGSEPALQQGAEVPAWDRRSARSEGERSERSAASSSKSRAALMSRCQPRRKSPGVRSSCWKGRRPIFLSTVFGVSVR